jgi:hypothetical protein
MTQPELVFSEPDTYVEAVADFFRRRPGQWIDGLTLASVGGAYAWRSRVSDCRQKFHMSIENRTRRVGRRVVSEYRFQEVAP